MICINCDALDTQVKNSRPSKKDPSIWRRRHCRICGTTFTTREEVDYTGFITIEDAPEPEFSVPRLTIYLAHHLAHRGPQAADEAYWLARTVQEKLPARTVTLRQLILTTQDVLRHFDAVAALQHAVKHGLVESIARPRRGRPRIRPSKKTD